ncbi:MAG: cyclic nucleotide-binding domain-containing protein [Labilithrix sp.]|nr:cyclic nucleotide-binding domain-containing protein [Labilithrix sp.]MCW5809638.1 cyclic nucleotide-binding domain-containing protein [Labilithrix sp.]
MSDSREALAARAEADVMACIGCNDCMLACPLPNAKLVTIAEINAAVHLPVVTNPRVAEFVMACTQCRQCVPACPSDLSRADMVLYNKLKVEDRVPNYTLMLQVGAQVRPSGWTLDDLAARVAEVPLFAKAARTDLRALLLKATLRQLAQNEVLCKESSFYDRLCIILSGSLDQSMRVPGGAQVSILVLGESSFFGEMAVMADQPEPYTVRALVPSLVLEIPKAAVHRLMTTSKDFKATMDELYRRRALWTYARSPTVLSALPEQAVTDILDKAELRTLKSGETILREGARPTDAYLVRSGFLRVFRNVENGKERALVYFREGDMFGLTGLLMGERHSPFSVQATTRAEVIRIPGAHLFEIIGRYPQARQVLEGGAQTAERVARENTFMPAPPPGQGGPKAATAFAMSAEVLLEKGLATGTEVLVVDQTKCVNCQNCIDACGRRHKYSRLALQGLQVENYLFPASCRHCEDPVCLLCSVNGIVRLPSGEITIVEDNCIGCGACAERCPYGNIRMHNLDTPQEGFLLRLMGMFGLRARKAAEEELKPSANRVAVKCDLCAGYPDYACVTACPVGAAFRIDPMKSLESQNLAYSQLRRA